jgi:hypothetical protein
LGVDAFPGFPGTQIALDPDGVPLVPEQDATDPLATAASAVTGVQFGTGRYRIDGLPPGQYVIEVQQINPNALGGSGIGPLDSQLPIPVLEFYNGLRESGHPSDTPSDFEPINVNAGTVVSNIDIVLNGFGGSLVSLFSETEPNDKKKKANRVTLPVDITAAANFDDPSLLRIEFTNQDPDRVEDLYRFTLDSTKVVYVVLEAIGAGAATSDLDLYLLDVAFNKKRVSISSASILAFSAGPVASELVGIRLTAGTYYIGVSAFQGTRTAYRLVGLVSD